MPSWQHALGIDIDVPPDFGHWLAGFVDGEGCFDINVQNSGRSIRCRLQIRLRDDDAAMLSTIRDTLGVGVVKATPDPRPTRYNQATWTVSGIADIIHVIIPLFEKYPLRAKKAKDFRLWARAARLIHSKAHLTPDGREEVLALKRQMQEGRQYNGSTLDTA